MAVELLYVFLRMLSVTALKTVLKALIFSPILTVTYLIHNLLCVEYRIFGILSKLPILSCLEYNIR